MKRSKFFYGWYIVVAGFFGNVAAGGIQSFTFGVIYPAMSDALGWGRGASPWGWRSVLSAQPSWDPYSDR